MIFSSRFLSHLNSNPWAHICGYSNESRRISYHPSLPPPSSIIHSESSSFSWVVINHLNIRSSKEDVNASQLIHKAREIRSKWMTEWFLPCPLPLTWGVHPRLRWLTIIRGGWECENLLPQESEAPRAALGSWISPGWISMSPSTWTLSRRISVAMVQIST